MMSNKAKLLERIGQIIAEKQEQFPRTAENGETINESNELVRGALSEVLEDINDAVIENCPE